MLNLRGNSNIICYLKRIFLKAKSETKERWTNAVFQMQKLQILERILK